MVTIGELIDMGAVDIATGFPCGDHNADGHGVPHLRPFNITTLGTVSLAQIKSVPTTAARDPNLVLQGDVLFNNTNTEELVGKSAYWDDVADVAMSNHMTRLRVRNPEVVRAPYLALALHHHWLIGASRRLCRRHVAQASIIGERFREISIPLPPTDVQVRIAEALGAVQRAIGIEQQIVSASRELRHTTMAALFTRGLRGEPQRASELGAIPESWDAITLGAVGRIGNGSTPKRTVSRYWSGGTHPWLTSGKIHERIIKHADEFVTEDAVQDCHLPLVPSGSLLIAITGQGKTLGNVALTTFDTSVSQHLAYCVVERNDIDPQFLRLYLASRYEYLRGLGQAGGSTKGALTCGGLKTVLVPKPSLREQEEVAHTLLLIEAKTEVHERRQSLLAELFGALLDDLMTGRRRVADLPYDAAVAVA